jgi:predicted nucleic acid-binding protein
VIVVADTSVILNLACVGYDHLLQQLYRDVRIPPAVADEFRQQAQINTRFQGLSIPSWLREQPATQIPASVTSIPGLDAGEAEAIALALEIGADALLIDEEIGRSAAIAHQLRTFGALGVLLQAKAAGFLPLVKPVLDDLRTRAGFWCSENLRVRILQAAREPV